MRRVEMPTRDWMTRDNAVDLAHKINLYWAKQGRTADAEAEEIKVGQGNMGKGGYVVRSDMINGLPRA